MAGYRPILSSSVNMLNVRIQVSKYLEFKMYTLEEKISKKLVYLSLKLSREQTKIKITFTIIFSAKLALLITMSVRPMYICQI